MAYRRNKHTRQSAISIGSSKLRSGPLEVSDRLVPTFGAIYLGQGLSPVKTTLDVPLLYSGLPEKLERLAEFFQVLQGLFPVPTAALLP